MDSRSTTQPDAGSTWLQDWITPRRIKKVVPIIGNSFYFNELLGSETKLAELTTSEGRASDQDLTVEERLTRLWSRSKNVQYPMTDDYNLARVALYLQVLKLKREFAREDYLEFLKTVLLSMNAEKQDAVVRRLKANVPDLSFAEIVSQLGYTKPLESSDPLDKLANIPFSNYITTSYHDFLERALLKADRKPITQYLQVDNQGKVTAPILDSRGKPLTAPILDSQNNILVDIPNLRGSKTYPVVYHLFGFESAPELLVLSEGDYIHFLISVVSDLLTPVTNSDGQERGLPRGLPMGLRTVISSNSLFLLGYQLQDWDFRGLFRLIMQMRNDDEERGIFIQIPPKGDFTEKILDYLSKYFLQQRFGVGWKHPTEFVQDLWNIWDEGQQSYE